MAMQHPFETDITYDLMDDSNILVTQGDKSGIFTGEGIYISGEIRAADPQLCNWINNVPNPDTQLSTNRIAGRDTKVASHLS
jgi:hypothetical protein